MPVTIFQQANQLNVSNTDLLFGVSSSFATGSQFQYILNLYNTGSNLLTTIKQQPNPSYRGVFNISNITNQYLDYDTDPILFQAGVDSIYYQMSNTAQYFKIDVTEQTGSSISSSVWVNPTPTNTSYGWIYLLNGTQNPNAGQFNWISTPYFRPEPTPTINTFNHNVALTRASRTQYVDSTDFMTISMLNGDILNNNNQVQDIYYTEFKIYNGNTLVSTQGEFNLNTGNAPNAGGPRPNPSEEYPMPFAWSQNDKSRLLSIGIGPRNITNIGNYNMALQPWTHYTVTLYNQEAVDQVNFNGIYDQFTIYKDTQCTGFEPVRFIWSNEFGVWDYFNFKLVTNKVTRLEKGNYMRNFVDYSTSQNSVPYNITNRGVTNYFTDIDEEWIVNSDWLTQEQAEWLEYLMYSPRVFIQDDFNIIPIVVTNTEFINKTNPKSQKLYKLEVSYKLANPKRSR